MWHNFDSGTFFQLWQLISLQAAACFFTIFRACAIDIIGVLLLIKFYLFSCKDFSTIKNSINSRRWLAEAEHANESKVIFDMNDGLIIFIWKCFDRNYLIRIFCFIDYKRSSRSCYYGAPAGMSPIISGGSISIGDSKSSSFRGDPCSKSSSLRGSRMWSLGMWSVGIWSVGMWSLGASCSKSSSLLGSRRSVGRSFLLASYSSGVISRLSSGLGGGGSGSLIFKFLNASLLRYVWNLTSTIINRLKTFYCSEDWALAGFYLRLWLLGVLFWTSYNL